jgi:flagellar motor protein MotB
MAVRNRRHLLSDHEGVREIWPAFTDVMSTMALIMFVLVLLAYVRNLVAEKRLDAYRQQIALSERQLRVVQAELLAGKAQLAASQAKLSEQQALVAESNRQLGNLRSQLQNIAVLRVSVLNKLKSAIDAELGGSTTDRVATIGDNGDIAVNESLVFEYNSYAIKKQAKPLLDSLAKALGNLLADDDVRANIDTIVIQGRQLRQLLRGQRLFQVPAHQSREERGCVSAEPPHRDRGGAQRHQRPQGDRRLRASLRPADRTTATGAPARRALSQPADPRRSNRLFG